MTISQTTITTRGYSVTIPTAAAAAFLAMSHDDQVELADVINSLDEDGELVDFSNDADVLDALVESMASELDVQDQAIDTFMDDRRWAGEALEAAYSDIENMNNILVQTARYVGQVRELLAPIGIVIQTDVNTGRPLLVFNA